MSFAELRRGSERTARRLLALGVRPGERVATTLPPGLEFAELVHAPPRVGAVLVPLNTRLTLAERRWQLEDCGARIVVDAPLEGEEEDARLRDRIEQDDPHSVIYTSGTTGRPRGVVLSYGNHYASASASASHLGMRADDRWLCVLPLHHVGGLAILLRSAIHGSAAIVHERFDSERVIESLRSGEATLASFVSTMVRRLAGAGLDEAPALRAALVGGGPIPSDLLDWAAERSLPLLPTYGMTETASQVATAQPGERAAHPLAGVELRIASDGEILIRGPMVARGALSADGWLHTGDRGELDAQGRLRVHGRLKELIVTGGENVSPVEVEEVLLAHPAVEDAAVVGLPDPEWGEAVAAFVVKGGGACEADLVEHCRARLASHKVPKRIESVPALPRNAAGKLLRDEVVRGGAVE